MSSRKILPFQAKNVGVAISNLYILVCLSSSEEKKNISLSLSEISNFLTDVECDHLISYAKRLGLEKSPLAKAETVIDDETSQRTFKIWDNNDDGFIEPVEVRLNTTVTVREVSRIYRKWIIWPEWGSMLPLGKSQDGRL